MNKIFKKILIIFLSVSIPLTVITLLLIFNIFQDNYYKILQDDLTRVTNLVIDRTKIKIINNEIDELRTEVKKLATLSQTRITIILKDGKVIADSEENPDKMENHAARLEIAKALNNRIGSSLRYSNTIKKKMLYLAQPVKFNNKIIAVVRASLFVEKINKVYSNLRNKIILSTIILDTLGLILLYYFSRRLTKPMEEIVEATNKFSDGNFNAKVIIDTNNEFKLLADTFNNMTDKIKELFESQSTQQEELKRILRSLQEGLIVINSDDTIVLHNKSFRLTINDNNPEGKKYWEILRDINLQKLINKVRKKQKHHTSEILINGIYYLASANYIHSIDQVVIVLFDISERKMLEDMKRDFIVNASHELKTPLTAIKGFIETLEDEANETQKKYLQVINRHTERLIAIVQDLITISKLEDQSLNTQKTKIDFHDLLMSIITIFDNKAREKGISFKINIDEDINNFKADSFKLEQLFINLIDNAVKYSNKGEISIKITDLEDAIEIIIADQGIGIPEEDLPRIFERFYTVDKSRAKKNVGTGLGLSIVKHIVNQHEGNIKVKSQIGKGTTFIITLPKET